MVPADTVETPLLGAFCLTRAGFVRPAARGGCEHSPQQASKPEAERALPRMLHSRGDPGTYSLSLVVTPSLWAPRQPAQGPGFSCPQCVGFCSSGSAFISPGNLDFPADSCPAGCVLQVGLSLKANRSRGVTWGLGDPGQASHCVMSLGELDPSMSVLWIESARPRNKNAPKEDNPSPPRAQRQASGIKSDWQGASCCPVHFLSPSQHRHHTATTMFDPSCHSAPACSFSHIEHVPGDQCAGAPS